MSDIKKMYTTILGDSFPMEMTVSFGDQTLIYRKKTWKITGDDGAVGDLDLDDLSRSEPDRERLRRIFLDLEFHGLARDGPVHTGRDSLPEGASLHRGGQG